MLELSQTRTAKASVASRQPRKLLLALVLLVAALVAVLVKDRDFWFGSDRATIESDVDASQIASQPAKNPTLPARTVAAPAAKKQIPVAKPVEQTATQPPVAVNRTVLPPLDVEVVAGNKRSNVHPESRISRVEIPNSPSIVPEDAAPATNAAERGPLAAVQPAQSANYPLLAQHMNVQGSVVLQALIGTDGVIENLRVVSGPAILAAAAQQAVREWRFKPIVQHGQAVESKAQITVNFSIKVADNSAKTTLAETRISDTLIVTR